MMQLTPVRAPRGFEKRGRLYVPGVPIINPWLDYWPTSLPGLDLAVAYRDSTANAQATSTTNTVTKPVGLTAGDIMLASTNNDTATVTPPSGGWAEVSSGSGTFTGWVQRVWWKIADAGDVAASNFTWTFSATVYSDVIMAAFSGGHQTTPIFGDTVNTGTGTTATGTGINGTPAGSLLAHFAVSSVGARSAGPSGMDNRETFDTNVYLDTLDLTAGGDTGDKTSTYASQSWIVHMVVIQPPAAAGSAALCAPGVRARSYPHILM